MTDIFSRKMKRGFTQTRSFCERWNIKISEDKTQTIYFSLGHGRTESHLTLKERYIPSFCQVKYLGAIFYRRKTWCCNLIPGIVAAFRWGVESGKLVYSSTTGHVSTCVYMSHRPKESFVPSIRGSSRCPWFKVRGKMSDKDLEQRINIKCCVKFGKRASETFVLLTVAYGEYAM